MQRCVSHWLGSTVGGPENQHEADEDMADGRRFKNTNDGMSRRLLLIKTARWLSVHRKEKKNVSENVHGLCSRELITSSKDDNKLTRKRASK